MFVIKETDLTPQLYQDREYNMIVLKLLFNNSLSKFRNLILQQRASLFMLEKPELCLELRRGEGETKGLCYTKSNILILSNIKF